MKSRSSASLFLLCALIINNYTDSSACDFTVAVGSPVTINLGLDQTDELLWKHNSQRVFKGLVITAPTKLNNVKLTTDGSLIIHSVKMKDNGDHEFEVFLSNGKSKAKKSITLCVHEKLIKPTVDITCIDGIPSISCEVEGKTGLTFNWYKNEEKMDGNSASLRNIERDQDYECAVEKPIPNEKSNKFRLSTTKYSSACDFTVAVGSPVTIKLGLDQTDELVWKHNSIRVFKGEVSTLPTKVNNVKLTSDGSLVIHSVKMEDNGNHEFEVFLSNGRSKAKKTITLCVHEKLLKPTVDITCIDGIPSISCEVEDKTGLTFSWYKNGKKIDGNSASLRNIERDQDYECAVEQPIPSEKSNKFRLSTTEDSSACDFTVAVGSPVTIKLGLDQTDELVWRHNSKRVFKGEVSTLPTKLKNAKVTSDGSLVINSVKKEDNGDHEFEAFLSSGRSKPESKKSVKLCVHEKPPKPTVDITCIDGIPSISCEVEDKTGLTFNWYKNEKKIDGNSASLRNIERDQDYECAVEKPIPNEKSNKFRLSTTKYSSACDFTVAVGSTITIYLGVDETDELVWRHNSKRVFKGLVITAPTKLKNVKLTTDGSLIIHSVKMEDNGDHEFEVFLSNGRSKAKKSITLCVHEMLLKPTVDITCIDGIPSISCEVEDKTGRTFSWYKNEKKMDENSASLRNIERDQDYECAVEKPIPSEKSNTFRLSTTEDEEELMLNSSPHSPTPLQTQQT